MVAPFPCHSPREWYAPVCSVAGCKIGYRGWRVSRQIGSSRCAPEIGHRGRDILQRPDGRKVQDHEADLEPDGANDERRAQADQVTQESAGNGAEGSEAEGYEAHRPVDATQET